ncbi:hypothetical protein EYR41_006483 [Orbilia oligospora]|uniref:Uncharacterized protein n=1 Tax=Orbilia oligospora TaxID=2813651 RepID=A0A8H2HMT8_ORBOL|nr:hypothetical protein TWF132_004172 [Orbilia oligospora]TGJ67350.1 hypothetical protein EYR41_006483 [Orbilia oligospora]
MRLTKNFEITNIYTLQCRLHSAQILRPTDMHVCKPGQRHISSTPNSSTIGEFPKSRLFFIFFIFYLPRVLGASVSGMTSARFNRKSRIVQLQAAKHQSARRDIYLFSDWMTKLQDRRPLVRSRSESLFLGWVHTATNKRTKIGPNNCAG